MTARAILLGAIVGLLLALLLGAVASRAVWDSWQRTFPRDITTDDVVVVLIDDESVREAGAWPWPRRTVAEMIEFIGEQQPKAIGIDIYFVEEDRMRPDAFNLQYDDDEIDPELREAIGNLTNWDNELKRVIGTYPTVMARVASDEQAQSDEEYAFNAEFEGEYEKLVEGDLPTNTLEEPFTLGSIFEIEAAALSRGMVNGAPDSDGLVRTVPLTAIADGKPIPGFAVELARVATEAETGEPSTLRWEDNTLLMGDRRIASNDSASLAFKMGRYDTYSYHPAINLFYGDVAPDTFRDKVVIIGVYATGTFDIVATPMGSEVAGPFVQAHAVDAILNGDWLDRPAWAMALEALVAAILILLIFAAGITMRLAPLIAAGIVAVSLPVLSALSYIHANLLLDPTRPLMMATCAAFGLFAARFLFARAERARLAAELVEERVKASKQQGELDAAFKIQMSMVPGEKVLSRLDERTDIAGVLRPAKSVGGDFFDAVKINENQLLFLVGDVTGKGVPAALFMALSKTLSKSNLARAGDGLQEAVSSLNYDLMDEADPEMGLTMLIGLIDCGTGKVELVNAGHENPMVVRPDGSVETLAMKGGPPFCVVPFDYPVEPHQLNAGETLIVITDGATEAANAQDELFGMEGVIKALGAVDDENASTRANALADQVRLFEGSSDPTDDLTIFALRYVGAHGAKA